MVSSVRIGGFVHPVILTKGRKVCTRAVYEDTHDAGFLHLMSQCTTSSVSWSGVKHTAGLYFTWHLTVTEIIRQASTTGEHWIRNWFFEKYENQWNAEQMTSIQRANLCLWTKPWSEKVIGPILRKYFVCGKPHSVLTTNVRKQYCPLRMISAVSDERKDSTSYLVIIRHTLI